MYEQMRQHKRLTVTNKIDSFLIQMKIGSQEVSSDKLKIIIEDMSLGGMKIVSDFDIGAPSESNFCFVLPVFKEHIYVKGEILRKVQRDTNNIEYGVRFCMEEDEKESVEEDLLRFRTYIEHIEKAS